MEENNRPLPKSIFEKSVQQMRSKGHPLRLRILEYLDVYGTTCVSDLAVILEMDSLSVSQALKYLRTQGILKGIRCGRSVFYDYEDQTARGLFVCMRRQFGILTGKKEFENPEYKTLLPTDFVICVAERIKLLSHVDRMRILEQLWLHNSLNVSQLSEVLGFSPLYVSQCLKKLREDCFVTCEKQGRFANYRICAELPKTLIRCMHNRYGSLKDKTLF